MPNTEPAIDNQGLIQYVIDRGKEAGLCRVFPTGAISPGEDFIVLDDKGEDDSVPQTAINFIPTCPIID